MGRGSGDRLYRLRLPPMDVPHGYDPTLILVLNLAGTFVFGLSGGLAAVRAKLDLFGVVVLAAVVGLAGGITRDLLIGVPPATFRDWRYLEAAGGAGVLVAAQQSGEAFNGWWVKAAARLAATSCSTAMASLARSLKPIILRNCCSASSIPAPVQRRHMSPFFQRLTLRLVRRTVSIIDSHGFVDASVRLSWPVTPSLVMVSVSSMPSLSEAAAPGSVRASSSASTRSRFRAASWSSSAQAPRSRRRTVSR